MAIGRSPFIWWHIPSPSWRRSESSAVLSSSARDAEDVEDYRGLFWRRPAIAGVFTVALLSLAGIPATMGFLGKFYILAAGANAAAWPLILILVVTSVAGLFYYLRIVVALYSSQILRQHSAVQSGALPSGDRYPRRK
jgi:NADH-quinone oxidoreductase subunit N